MTYMKFNGVDMSRFFRITNVTRDVGNSRKAKTIDAPKYGENLQDLSVSSKEITVSFTMIYDDPESIERAKHELAGVLDVSTPKKLEFADEPDKYYLGLPINDISMNLDTRWFQRGKITFLIPDGVAHSTTYKTFQDVTADQSRYKLKVVNNGTVPAHPIITVRNNAENGYVGVLNTSGVFEVGDTEENPIKIGEKTENIYDFRKGKMNAGVSQAAKNQAILQDGSNNQNGTPAIVNWNDKSWVMLGNKGAGGSPGVGLTWDIPADSSGVQGSLYDYIYWFQIFWAGRVNQRGIIKVFVSDTDGNFLYGAETYKSSNGTRTAYNFLVGTGVKNKYQIIKSWSFEATHLNTQNPFNPGRGHSDIVRDDDMLTIFWWGTYNKVQVPYLKGKRSAKLHVYLGGQQGYDLVTRMYLTDLFYQKRKVPQYKNPNRYQAGSEIVINSENDTVQIDGMNKLSDVVHSSRFLEIPPGESELEIYSSSWSSNVPSVKVEFEERWL